MKQALTAEDKFLRANTKLNEMIISAFERIGEEDECKFCGGIGYTLEEMPTGDGTMSQYEERCERRLEVEEDREAEQ